MTNPAAAWEHGGYWIIDETVARDYYGDFHAYLRVHQTSGAVGDIQFKLAIDYEVLGAGPTALYIYETDPVTVNSTVDWAPIDLGVISLPSGRIGQNDQVQNIVIWLFVYGNGVSDIDVYDLALIPADELFMDASAEPAAMYRGSSPDARFIDIDGLTSPKHCPRAFLRFVPNRMIISPFVYDGTQPPDLLPDTQQRLWWMSFRYDEAVPAWYSEPWDVRRVALWANESFLLARGDE